MSLTLVLCSQCGKSGTFPICIVIDKSTFCDECRQIVKDEIKFYFCCKKCFDSWLKKNKDSFDCKDCRGTGWFGGYEQNGECNECHGAGKIMWKDL